MLDLWDKCGGAWRVSNISHLTQPHHKPDSNEKHKHLHCGLRAVQWSYFVTHELFKACFIHDVASLSWTYSKLTHSVCWEKDNGVEWFKRTLWFTTLDYYRMVQSSCAVGEMTGWEPPLCLPHSWSPPAVGVERPDMHPAVRSNIWKHAYTYTNTFMSAHTHAAPPLEADKCIQLINILFHTHLGPYVTHISKLGS